MKTKLLGLLILTGAIGVGASYAGYSMPAPKPLPIASSDRSDAPAFEAYKKRRADGIIEDKENRSAISDLHRKWRQDDIDDAKAARH